MCKRFVCLQVLVAISFLTSTYADIIWNGSVSSDWTVGGNWDGGVTPGTADRAGFLSGGLENAAIYTGNFVQVGHVITGQWGAGQTINVQEDAYLMSGGGQLGFSSSDENAIGVLNSNGFIAIDDGNNGGNFDIAGAGGGRAEVNIYDGTFDIGWRLYVGDAASNGGTLNLFGGIITAGMLQIDNGLVNIEQGTLRFSGGSSAALEALVTQWVIDGRLVAYGGSGTIDHYFDNDLYKMVVTAIGPDLETAQNPLPDGLTAVPSDIKLTWTGAPSATGHNVYFGLSLNDVDDYATPVVTNQSDAVYQPAILVPGQVYYWRIDELFNSTVKKGRVWSFVVDNFVLVDGMDTYSSDTELQNTWQASDPAKVSLDQDSVHWGGGALKCDYSISANTVAEFVKEYSFAQDWSAGSDQQLNIWFKGAVTNSDEQLFVWLEDSIGSTGVVSYPDSDEIMNTNWQLWSISLDDFASVNLGSITRIAIGIGDKQGNTTASSGTLFFDDIRVYSDRCVSGSAADFADLTGDYVVNLADLAEIGRMWMQADMDSEALLADLNSDCSVDINDVALLANDWLKSEESVFIQTANTIGIDNGLIRLEFDNTTGSLVSIKNQQTGDEYLKHTGGDGNPFRAYVNTTQIPPTLKTGYPYVIQPVENSMGGTLVDPGNCQLIQSTFQRNSTSAVLHLVIQHDNPDLTFELDVTVPDGDVTADIDLTVRNHGSGSCNVMTAVPYLTGLELGSDRNTNLGVRLRDFGQSRAPAWEKQGGLYGRGWDGQWNAVYETSLNEGFGFIVKDPEVENKIFHRFAGGGMSVLYVDKQTLSSLQEISYPTVQIVVNTGDWKKTAMIYRQWFDTAFEQRPIPEWVSNLDIRGSGWFPPPGDLNFSTFYDLSKTYYLGNTYDLREFAMYWQGIVDMGYVHSYDHTNGLYEHRSDLGGTPAIVAGIADLEETGRGHGLYVAGKTVRLDSPLFNDANPSDWLLMDTPGKQIAGSALSLHVCPGYNVWQDHLAQELSDVVAATGVKYVRLDELSFGFEPCYNPAHNHEDPYYGASSVELVKKVRQALDLVDPDVLLLTENAVELFTPYSNGALVLWSPGPDIAPLRLTAPEYMGFSYQNGQIESAVNSFICANWSAGNAAGWATAHHNSIWGPGLEEKPSCYPAEGTGGTLQWHTLDHMFDDAISRCEPAEVNPHVPSFDAAERENWTGRLWKSPDYWVMTCGSRIGDAPNEPVLVEIPELPADIDMAFEFDTKTLIFREKELIRTGGKIYVTLNSGFSTVLLPTHQCPPIVTTQDESRKIYRSRTNNINLNIFAPWRAETSCEVTVDIPGLTVQNTNPITLPGTVTVTIPESAKNGMYYLKVDGDCLPLKVWYQLVP